MSSSKRQFTILKQISKLIPRNLVSTLAKEHGVDKQSRSISPWSHIISLMYAQLSHAMSLNDVCDALKNHSGAFKDIREASPISKNGFSYANRTRNPKMAEDLFWGLFKELKKNCPSFGYSNTQKTGVPYRFKRAVSAVDSSTIKFICKLFRLG